MTLDYVPSAPYFTPQKWPKITETADRITFQPITLSTFGFAATMMLLLKLPKGVEWGQLEKPQKLQRPNIESHVGPATACSD